MPDPDPPDQSGADSEFTIDLTTPGDGGNSAAEAVRALATAPAAGSPAEPRLLVEPYSPEKQRDSVRLIVTIGLLLLLGWVVVWACIESASWKDHWERTKEMLQIILPALTGLIGSVVGFYFGSGVKGAGGDSSVE